MTDTDSTPTRELDPGTDCCRATAPRDDTAEGAGRWLAGPSLLDAELPADVRAGVERLLDGTPVETLADWVRAVRRRTGGGSIATTDLCHADGETPHWGEVGGDRYHFHCFYDAVILAALMDRPVDVRTASPNGAIVRASAAGTRDLAVEPSEAVFSFGIAEDVQPPADGVLSPGDVYGAVCPYVRAFPHPDAYGRWAPTVSAATVAMPLDGATELAAALAV